jgi:hypothetical protein
MKKYPFLLLAATIMISVSCQQAEKAAEIELDETVETMPEKQLRHVVLFKFKDDSSQEDITKIEEAFLNLPNEIPQIQSIEWGTNNSPEGLNEGLTHCFFLTFASEEDRAIYLPHPAHKAFGELLGPHLDKVTVVDYWVK